MLSLVLQHQHHQQKPEPPRIMYYIKAGIKHGTSSTATIPFQKTPAQPLRTGTEVVMANEDQLGLS